MPLGSKCRERSSCKVFDLSLTERAASITFLSSGATAATRRACHRACKPVPKISSVLAVAIFFPVERARAEAALKAVRENQRKARPVQSVLSVPRHLNVLHVSLRSSHGG